MKIVTETELKHIKSLLTKKGRKEHRQFLAEGVRVLEEALKHRVHPQAVYCAPSVLTERGQALVERFVHAHIPVMELPAKKLERIADTDTPQGIVALFERPSMDPVELYRPHMRTVLLCENVSDPGNLGTLIRSALAFRFSMVCLGGHCAEAYAPKTVRSSAGTVFGVPVATLSVGGLKEMLATSGMRLVATDIRGGDTMNKVAQLLKAGPVMLAVGSEGEGLSADVLSLSSAVVRLNHESAVESLNAAVAGSIVMSRVYDLGRKE